MSQKLRATLITIGAISGVALFPIVSMPTPGCAQGDELACNGPDESCPCPPDEGCWVWVAAD